MDTVCNDGSSNNVDAAQNIEEKPSKRSLKRIKYRQEWLEKRAEKRKEEKLKKKERLHRAREEGKDIYARKKLKSNTMEASSCQLHVVIDCSFNDRMSEKDLHSTVNQVQHAYGANRRARDPMQLHITSLGGSMLARLEQIADYKNWDLHFHTESYESLFEKSSIVYLTSDSPNVLDRLEDNKVYIIGGITDHNKHKGLCLDVAKQHGVGHAQLPISDYMELKTRQVLTVNQVFEILVQFYETGNWETAFFNVIPKRKGAQHKAPVTAPVSATTPHCAANGDEAGGVLCVDSSASDVTDKVKATERLTSVACTAANGDNCVTEIAVDNSNIQCDGNVGAGTEPAYGEH